MTILIGYPFKIKLNTSNNSIRLPFTKFANNPFSGIKISLASIARSASWNNIGRDISWATSICYSNEMIGGDFRISEQPLLRSAIDAVIIPVLKTSNPVRICEITRKISKSCPTFVFRYTGMLTTLHKALFVILPLFIFRFLATKINVALFAVRRQFTLCSDRWIKILNGCRIVRFAPCAVFRALWRFVTRSVSTNNHIARFTLALVPIPHSWSLKKVFEWIFAAAYSTLLKGRIRGIINLSHGVYLALTQSLAVAPAQGLFVSSTLYRSLSRIGAA